ncbi:MAG TPA: helix-turn-helix domain-containing protein, partial [Gemmatimonadaceae bacterium]|nr:helix-turn-helix domain-containing protein [Gemmatimonadaceae bacterium]
VIELVRRELSSTKPTVRDATLVAIGRAHQRLSPEALAKILGVRRKALTERLVQAGFPPAQRLIAWGRLIVAARMLEDDERSADSVAMALDYPSGSAFRNTCQRYLRSTPHEIRARGGASFAVKAFLAEVRGEKPAPQPELFDQPEPAGVY